MAEACAQPKLFIPQQGVKMMTRWIWLMFWILATPSLLIESHSSSLPPKTGSQESESSTEQVTEEAREKPIESGETPVDETDAITMYASGIPPFVQTRLGGINGIRKDYLGRYVDTFLGIPYAQPPVGTLRFKAPEAAYAWQNSINATEFKSACRQTASEWPHHLTRHSGSCSEDCLYLNIWTPSEKMGKPRAVMVFFHGGDFILGSPSWPEYDGGLISAFGDVVVASMSYRLGRLGFLDAKSHSAPGNQGLLDQNMALRWIHDNIESFGGDRTQVTLFGNDAGAASIGLHILSPMSAGLFKRAILQSGSAFWKLRHIRSPAETVPLGTQGSSKVENCSVFPRESRFRQPDKRKFWNSAYDHGGPYRGLDYGEIPSGRVTDDMYDVYGPTYDNDFLPLNPHMSASMGIFNDVEVMIGTANNEGAWEFMRSNQWRNFSSVESFKAINLLKFIKHFFEEFQFKKLVGPKATEGIYHYFASNLRGNDIQHNRQFVFDFIGDYVHTCPSTHFAELLADRNVSVYYYRFAHAPHTHPETWPLWVGATHFDEVPYVFGAPLMRSAEYSNAERDFSASVMDAWTSFAKTGLPVTPSGQTWPKYSRKNPNYLRLSTQGFSRRDAPSKENCNFWRSFNNFDVWSHVRGLE
ncbi:cholinesterase-like [Galendromus occidentalis]|uniref:acetylcholinesterase n=1 Tax=Galendromus occidentalis TaxID=34638 RepID=A0AAJ6QPN7_9ACAR|nr:cholinesterase-like [Galendromus occidentalis]